MDFGFVYDHDAINQMDDKEAEATFLSLFTPWFDVSLMQEVMASTPFEVTHHTLLHHYAALRFKKTGNYTFAMTVKG